MSSCAQKDGSNRIHECNGTACDACRRRATYDEVADALRQAAHDTYANHEHYTSDAETKRRLDNAAWQVVDRALTALFPQEHEHYALEWTANGPESRR